MAHRTGAIESKDLERVVVDTTVQEKAIAHPTDARLTHRAIEKLVEMAQTRGRRATPKLSARGQTRGHYGGALYACPPVQARSAATQIPAHATGPHHPRRSPQDRGRCRTAGSLWSAARSCIADLPSRAAPTRTKGLLMARPEVECIGRGKARTPYEFGCKVSIATPATAPKGGQFVLHAKALHGNPYDGHTLGPVITYPAPSNRYRAVSGVAFFLSNLGRELS